MIIRCNPMDYNKAREFENSCLKRASKAEATYNYKGKVWVA
ncbi:hypothetical protein CWATWH0401_182 [Crocosphaera watsonii WH 0401]|uniref:Uncharacterized protein n=1 Tax=Crocosphaera watsonii WH 0401 TaxID=555881 RepID=T2JAA4_CROWT|nr:hypothetical protein CWATWH0401_182 [Crocosphaera watsonii WH 0401]